MAHRGELLTQAADKIKTFSGLDSALEKAESSSLGSTLPVTVGSVQTLCRKSRLNQFPEDYFQTIIVDEAHHIMSESYRSVLDHFAKAKVLGITATPDRADHKSLASYFDSKAYEYTLTQAIHDKYLCPIKVQMIPLKLDIRNVKVSNGDYNAGEIGTALEPYLRMIAQEIAQNYSHRKVVVFLPLIQTSQAFCSMLCEMGLAAAEVNGNSPDRTQILQDFADGKYSILCNSMLLTEGWDCPSVDCVVMLRPTKIRSLYQQCIGRGTRICPGKNELLILDFLWLTERHDLCRPSSLIAKDTKIAQRIDEMIAESSGEAIDIIDAEAKAVSEEIAAKAREREASLAKALQAGENRKGKQVDLMELAISLKDEDLLDYEPIYAWEKEPASPKQIDCLRNVFNVSTEHITSKGMASICINKLLNRRSLGLSTPRQIHRLETFGYINVGTWTKEQASKKLDEIVKNHWRVPYGEEPKTYKP